MKSKLEQVVVHPKAQGYFVNTPKKSVDDYKAKTRLYAQNPRVVHIGIKPELPHFGCVRFSSYDEMNAWKKEFLRSLARRGGCTWKKS